MVGVNVGVDFKHESAELIFAGNDFAFLGAFGLGAWGNFHKAVQQFLHAKVVQCRTKKHGANFPAQVCVSVKLWIHALDQFNLFAEGVRRFGANAAIQGWVVQVLEGHGLGNLLLVGLFVKEQRLIPNIVDPLEACPHTYGPGKRGEAKAQFAFNFIQEVKSVAAFSVQFVDKDHDGRGAHAAHLHQFFGLSFDAFGNVDDYDGGIDGGERSERVFRKILVTRRVQNIDVAVLILKGHDRRRHGNTALLLDFHEVGRCRFLDFIGLYRTCLLYGTSKKQKFFRQCGLAGIRVGHYAKGSAAGDFVLNFHAVVFSRAKVAFATVNLLLNLA